MEIPGLDVPGAPRGPGGVRSDRSIGADRGRTHGLKGQSPAVAHLGTDQATLSSTARLQIDATTGAQATSGLRGVGGLADADAARALARSVRDRIRDEPDQAHLAQANLSHHAVMSLIA
jgi:hypothetical protein